VLFGTNAFWEGIDVVGDALSCVMVTRLPFAVPTDPVYAARAEQFDNPFSDYAVPQAVLRLKQGFGRLIRSRTDRGAVIVLDRRLVTRFYGQVFLRSLPPCSIKQGPSARAAAELAEWLELTPGVQQMELLAAPG
jgi:DNA polymerase-3 subunit epsilon/ATP-dependent DNA helicase DinG